MKPISLPITLLGRIAPLASKPSREELRKEASDPITISELMKDNWIEEAFEQASSDLEEYGKIAEKVRRFLDECTPNILDRWSHVVGLEKSIKFAEIIANTDGAVELVDELTAIFTLAGYLLAKSEEDADL